MCDTFVCTTSATEDGSVIFGKNSDREPNEAQILEYIEPASFGEGEKTACTYLRIPQVRHIHGVLLSRPFWMYGAEMGANDKGVVIGNEAVFTKLPVRKRDTLTGMDLLRLALERADTAEKALQTIVDLMAEYGQGGICGLSDKKMTYHNSYIICDPSEAWVLETAGDMWAAKKVEGYYSISNGLTIGEEYDLSHPDLVDTALKNGWLKKGKDFNFARCYSDWLYTTFSGSKQRRSYSYGELKKNTGSFTVSDAIGILRSHPEKDSNHDKSLINTRICVHGGNGLTRNSQTAGSLVAHLRKENPVYWVTGTSSPCAGVFKPVGFKGKVLPDLGPSPTEKYNPETYWWKHEELHRELLKDFSRVELFAEERNRLEAVFIKRAYETGDLFSLTGEAFSESLKAESEWLKLVKGKQSGRKPGLMFRKYWEKKNKSAGIKKE